MVKNAHFKTGRPANSADYPHVSIYFEDDTITYMFSELIEALGIKTCILGDISEAQAETRIITEPQFFPALGPDFHGKCLIVGNKDTLHGVNEICLSRPLTEEKVEEALGQFLAPLFERAP